MHFPFGRAPRSAEDFAAEIRAHLELETDRLIAEGVPAAEAAGAARRNFGNVTTARERFHERHRFLSLDEFLQDIRYALRRLRRTPWATAVILASLALVTGANTALFGLIHSIYLRRLDLPHAADLVAVRPMAGGHAVILRDREYRELARARGLPTIAAYAFEPLAVGAAEPRAVVYGDVVSGNYFDVLGVRPMLGRFFTAREEVERAPVAVVSYDFWRTHLASDSAAVGRPLRINDQLFTLVGVTQPSFAGLYFSHTIQVILPLETAGTLGITDLPHHYLDFVARIPPGEAKAQIAAAIQRSLDACCRDLPVSGDGERAGKRPILSPGDAPTGDTRYGSNDRRPHVDLTDASHGLTWSDDLRSDYRATLFALFAAVGLLTILACANVAALQLARAAARRRELAVRASLGASHARLLKQLLTESALLGLGGGLLGLVLARVATGQLLQHLPPSAARLRDVTAWHADPVVFAFTALVMLCCTLFFGLWPAWRASRVDLRAHLGGDRPGRASPRGWAAENALVVGQVSVALVLMSAAALFVATLRNLVGANGGTAADGVVVAQLWLGDFEHPESLDRLYDDLRVRVAAVPGVKAVAFGSSVPVMNQMWAGSSIRRFDDATPAERRASVPTASVDPGFFRLYHVTLQRGRLFDQGDLQSGGRVAVVSASFESAYGGDRDVVGERFFLGRDSIPVEIVGVVADANFNAPRQAPRPMLYQPIAPHAYPYPSVALGVLAPTNEGPVRDALARLLPGRYPNVSVQSVRTMREYLADVLARERLVAFLATIFGGASLALAAMGLYGLLAYHTARRTREIGVRMALGASPSQALWLVVRQGAWLTAIGVGVGIPLALAGLRVVRSALFGVSAGDPRVLLGGAAGLLLVGVLAALGPARRATRVDPVRALRVD